MPTKYFGMTNDTMCVGERRLALQLNNVRGVSVDDKSAQDESRRRVNEKVINKRATSPPRRLRSISPVKVTHDRISPQEDELRQVRERVR
jgi:hypothetical protein